MKKIAVIGGVIGGVVCIAASGLSCIMSCCTAMVIDELGKTVANKSFKELVYSALEGDKKDTLLVEREVQKEPAISKKSYGFNW